MAQSAIPAAPLSQAPASAPVAVTPVSLKEIAPWAVFTGILALILLYFVGAEQGAVALVSGETVHEWVHDGRHLLGFPCH
ncbi:CbtB-domain containing protein [Streptomyces sp. NPDC058953]|uniref:CbtB domain-containing protein n=1 Tax=unclassified Streptomyces TaxID=2593676 RepID=UPI0036CEDF8F